MRLSKDGIVAAFKRYAPLVAVAVLGAVLGALLLAGYQQARQFYVDYQDFKLIRAWATPYVRQQIERERRQAAERPGQTAVKPEPTPPSQEPEKKPEAK